MAMDPPSTDYRSTFETPCWYDVATARTNSEDNDKESQQSNRNRGETLDAINDYSRSLQRYRSSFYLKLDPEDKEEESYLDDDCSVPGSSPVPNAITLVSHQYSHNCAISVCSLCTSENNSLYRPDNDTHTGNTNSVPRAWSESLLSTSFQSSIPVSESNDERLSLSVWFCNSDNPYHHGSICPDGTEFQYYPHRCIIPYAPDMPLIVKANPLDISSTIEMNKGNDCLVQHPGSRFKTVPTMNSEQPSVTSYSCVFDCRRNPGNQYNKNLHLVRDTHSPPFFPSKYHGINQHSFCPHNGTTISCRRCVTAPTHLAEMKTTTLNPFNMLDGNTQYQHGKQIIATVPEEDSSCVMQQNLHQSSPRHPQWIPLFTTGLFLLLFGLSFILFGSYVLIFINRTRQTRTTIQKVLQEFSLNGNSVLAYSFLLWGILFQSGGVFLFLWARTTCSNQNSSIPFTATKAYKYHHAPERLSDKRIGDMEPRNGSANMSFGQTNLLCNNLYGGSIDTVFSKVVPTQNESHDNQQSLSSQDEKYEAYLTSSIFYKTIENTAINGSSPCCNSHYQQRRPISSRQVSIPLVTVIV